MYTACSFNDIYKLQLFKVISENSLTVLKNAKLLPLESVPESEPALRDGSGSIKMSRLRVAPAPKLTILVQSKPSGPD